MFCFAGAVACASACGAQDSDPQPPSSAPADQTAPSDSQAIETPATAAPDSDQPLASELLFTPAPMPMSPLLGPTIYDPPVPYFSQISPIDDPTAFDPRLELASDEVKLGWNLLLELDYVKPFIHNGLNSGNLLAGQLPEAVSVPAAQPGWSVMPRIDLSYRFESGLGEFHTIFRSLNAVGRSVDPNFDAAGAGTLASHLSLNVLDFDYAFTEFNPGRIGWLDPSKLIFGRWGLNMRPEQDPNPTFRMKWAYGVRVANVFFDSRGTGNQILSERVSNNFTGAGPRASVDFLKLFAGRPSLGAYTRFEFSGVWGQINQSFTRTELLPVVGAVTGAGRVHNVDTGVPVFEMESGLSFMPQLGCNWLRFTGGYRFEQWWYIGQTSTSNAGLTLQGVFLRGEWGY
jgi:major outer membrane protein